MEIQYGAFGGGLGVWWWFYEGVKRSPLYCGDAVLGGVNFGVRDDDVGLCDDDDW